MTLCERKRYLTKSAAKEGIRRYMASTRSGPWVIRMCFRCDGFHVHSERKI